MTDSSFIAGFTTGVASGIGREVTQRAWTASEAWIRAKFLDHAETVVVKAKENTAAFLQELGQKVKALEQESEITKSLMATTMDEPGFSVLLQKAVLASSQTGDAQKHKILSDLVTQRLKAESNSLYSVTSQLAVDAIAQCTPNQLRMLGALTALKILSPAVRVNESEKEYQDYYGRWLVCRFAPYNGLWLSVDRLDIAHLQSVGCLAVELRDASFGNEDELEILLNRKIRSSKVTIDVEFLRRLPVQSDVRNVMDGPLGDMALTTVGQMIGILVSDRVSSFEPSNFAEWQKAAPPNVGPPEDAIRAMMAPFGVEYKPETTATDRSQISGSAPCRGTRPISSIG